MEQQSAKEVKERNSGMKRCDGASLRKSQRDRVTEGERDTIAIIKAWDEVTAGDVEQL